ncbi:MAG TPA: hypothetical protein VG079_05865, partial [Gaiellaceae bacterium]|nr:hypothetical protein [Gaiellaceae bacterium]
GAPMRRGHTGVFETGPAAAPFCFVNSRDEVADSGDQLSHAYTRVGSTARPGARDGFAHELRIRTGTMAPEKKELVGERLARLRFVGPAAPVEVFCPAVKRHERLECVEAGRRAKRAKHLLGRLRMQSFRGDFARAQAAPNRLVRCAPVSA